MNNKLNEIIIEKTKEVASLKNKIGMAKYPFKPTSHSFYDTLKQDRLNIIAEIKRKSPSKGSLARIDNVAELAKQYEHANASAISVLTENTFFSGTTTDLIEVRENVNLPILRKDFIIDQVQIEESAMLGANAILLIVAILKERTKEFVALAHELNLETLVEVHDETEMDFALKSGTKIIGINNRSLINFEVHTENAFKLLKFIPDDILSVAESGIHTPQLAKAYYNAGFNGVLIGEALVKSNDVYAFIKECHE